jgi:hypothetical protein
MILLYIVAAIVAGVLWLGLIHLLFIWPKLDKCGREPESRRRLGERAGGTTPSDHGTIVPSRPEVEVKYVEGHRVYEVRR